jgi:hypothetical protein
VTGMISKCPAKTYTPCARLHTSVIYKVYFKSRGLKNRFPIRGKVPLFVFSTCTTFDMVEKQVPHPGRKVPVNS